jgi:hypothetical protein
MRLLPTCIASLMMLATANPTLWSQEQETEVTATQQQQLKQGLDTLLADIKNAHALAQQVEQTALALQQLGRQLEKLEKLENMVLGSEGSDRQQLLEQAELFAATAKQHLESTSAKLMKRDQMREIEQARVLSPAQLGELRAVTQSSRLLPLLSRLQEESSSRELFKTEADLQSDQARLERARAEEAAVVNAALAARASELAEITQRDLMEAELQKASELNRAREIQLRLVEKLKPTQTESGDKAASHLEYRDTQDHVAGRMASLEQRLEKIEALLQKLTEGK